MSNQVCPIMERIHYESKMFQVLVIREELDELSEIFLKILVIDLQADLTKSRKPIIGYRITPTGVC